MNLTSTHQKNVSLNIQADDLRVNMKSRFSKFWHVAEQIVRTNVEQFTISGTRRAISRVFSLSEIAKAAGGICQRRASDTEKVADEVEELSQYDVYHRKVLK